jgi:hypothetical protein
MAPINSFVLLFLILCQCSGVAFAADRVALVIGNSKYEHLGTLPNTLNDAQSMSASLKEMGYETTTLIDASDVVFRRELRNFSLKSSNASIAVVFYAGHGAQVNGENYLLPVDVEAPKRESDIRLSSIKVDDVINSLQSKTKVIFLDACRDNPALLKSLASGRGAYRGGLAPANGSSLELGGSGVFIAYATDAGSVALDSIGKQNSPFTTALLSHIKKPMSIDDMFSMVTRDVRQATKNVQRPYKYASMDGIVCLTATCSSNIIKKETAVVSERSLSNKFVLFNSGLDPKVLTYIDPTSIQKIGSRVKYTVKYVYQEPPKFAIPKTVVHMQGWVVDCKSNMTTNYQGSAYDASGNLIGEFQSGLPELVELTTEYLSPSLGWSSNQLACNPHLSHPEFFKEGLDSLNWKRILTLDHGGAVYFSERSVSRKGEVIELLGKIVFPLTPIGEVNSKYAYGTGYDGQSNTPKIKTLVTRVTINCEKKIHSQMPDYFFDEGNGLVAYSRYLPEFAQAVKIEPGPVQMVAGLLCD